MADSGWPADEDLASWLGGVAVDETLSTCRAAAQADAVIVLDLDPLAGVTDAGQWAALLNLGAWWYQSRNRPDGPDAMYPTSTPYTRRVAESILLRGRIPIA